MKVLVTDRIVDEGIAVLEQKGHQVDVITGLSLEGLLSIVGDYDALIVRSATRVTREVIEAAVKCKVIGRAGVTCDNIDIDAATARSIIRLQRSYEQYRLCGRAYHGAHAAPPRARFPRPTLRCMGAYGSAIRSWAMSCSRRRLPSSASAA